MLWESDLKHRSELSFDHYNQNKIQLLEWAAYSPDLNPIKYLGYNLKYRLGSLEYNIIESLKYDIKTYWQICSS